MVMTTRRKPENTPVTSSDVITPSMHDGVTLDEMPYQPSLTFHRQAPASFRVYFRVNAEVKS